jgi:hypothetical protein
VYGHNLREVAMHKIIKVSEYQFQFEYEDVKPKDIPKIKKGDIFEHEGKKYKIDYHEEVFAEDVYTSFFIIAEPVE